MLTHTCDHTRIYNKCKISDHNQWITPEWHDDKMVHIFFSTNTNNWSYLLTQSTMVLPCLPPALTSPMMTITVKATPSKDHLHCPQDILPKGYLLNGVHADVKKNLTRCTTTSQPCSRLVHIISPHHHSSMFHTQHFLCCTHHLPWHPPPKRQPCACHHHE